jgi:hypothetical protein
LLLTFSSSTETGNEADESGSLEGLDGLRSGEVVERRLELSIEVLGWLVVEFEDMLIVIVVDFVWLYGVQVLLVDLSGSSAIEGFDVARHFG